jgi:NitT/TauT family transport system ATP-binding protein
VSTATQIALEGASKEFVGRGETVLALQPTSIEIARERFVALVGPSGCGKSTVLNMIAGLQQPTSGRVVYDGNPVTGPNRQVGYMTQKDTLLPWRSVADNIGLALELKIRSTSRSDRDNRVAQMIELVGLKGFERHYPGERSGGMRKRVSLARSLIYEPETLLMDEPFAALDAQLRLVMHDELLRLTRLRRMTVVFVTHDLGEAITLADLVVVFTGRPGRIKTLREIPLAHPRDAFRLRFSEDFARLHEELWNELKDEVAKGTDR